VEEEKSYERILEVRKGKPLFVLHEGRLPAVNHWETSEQDPHGLVVKTRSMAGQLRPDVPPGDCHVGPIRTQVETELGGKGNVPPDGVSQLCRHLLLAM